MISENQYGDMYINKLTTVRIKEWEKMAMIYIYEYDTTCRLRKTLWYDPEDRSSETSSQNHSQQPYMHEEPIGNKA